MDKTIKLHLACSTDELRPAMCHILLTKEVMVATNAHILAVIPTKDVFNEQFIEGIPEDGVLLHQEDYKKMLMYDTATWKKEGEVIKCYGKKRPLLVEVETQDEVGNYPNWQAVIPQDYGVELPAIGLDMRLAYELQQALGLHNCRLDFAGVSRAVRVSHPDPKENNNRYGIIMPVMLK